MSSLSVVTYALSKKYTKETAAQFGALKGAACTIKSIEHQNGQNIVTFQWRNNDDEVRESTMIVDDGTPIYTWTSGNRYKYGDLVIYASCFYRCIQENSDSVFDDKKWNEIGSPDGDYDIVQNSSLLPPRFTAADTKMYYCIEDELFYLWNGEKWVKQDKLVQYITMPNPSLVFLNRIVQYIGETTSDYINGYFYKCQYIEDSQKYEWIQFNSTVARTGKYNDLIDRPATYLIGEESPIILTSLEDGYYSIIGSYSFYEGGTIYIATSKKYFVIESSLDNCNIVEISSSRIKKYTYSINEGLIENKYLIEDDISGIFDEEFEPRANIYVSNNVASSEDIQNLFS